MLVAFVEHHGHAAAHARAEVAPRRTEDEHDAAGHVLAAVVAHALDDGDDAAVANGEALSCAPVEGAPRDGAVEHGVADDDLLAGGEGDSGGGRMARMPPESDLPT